MNKFGWTSIWSSDLNNLLPFYRDVVGLQVAMESEGFVVLGAANMEEPALGIGTHSEVHGRASDPYRHMIGLTTEDIQGECKRLKAAGVEFIEEPASDGDGMWMATFKDPEGNIVQISQGTP